MALFAWSYMFSRFSRTPNLWQTDKRADRHRAMAYTALAHRRAIKKNDKKIKENNFTRSNPTNVIKLNCRSDHVGRDIWVYRWSNCRTRKASPSVSEWAHSSKPAALHLLLVGFSLPCLLIFPTFSLPFLFSFFFCLPFPLLSWDVVFRMWHAARPVLQRLGVA